MIFRICLTLTLLSGAMALHAQDTTEYSIDTALWNLAIDEVVVTAQHEPTHYTNAVHKVSIIEGKKIEKLGMANLAEVLSTELNMQVNSDLILGSGLTIQGISGENVQIMIDGVPVIGRLDGNIDLSQIQVNNLQRIEIIEGAMSAQFGSNASGGVINLITRSSQVPKLEVTTKNRGESKGILDNALFAGYRTGKWYLQGNVRRYHSELEKTDSLRIMKTTELSNGNKIQSKKYPWNPKLQWSGDGSLQYKWSDSLRIQYTYRYFDESVTNYGEKRRPAFLPYAFDDEYHTRRSDHSVSANGYIGKKLYFTTTQAINTYDRTSATFRKNFEEDELLELEDSRDSTTFMNYLSRNMISFRTPVGLDLQAGAEWQKEVASGTRFSGSDVATSDRELSNLAGWLSLKYKVFPGATLLGNMRYGKNSRFDHPLLPSLQILWKPGGQWSVRAGYSRGFRAPSLKEMAFEFIDVNHFILGNEDLDAETSSNYNLNISKTFPLAGRGLQTEAGLFSHKIENRIILAEYEENKFTYQNLTHFRTHGLDLKLEYPFTDFLKIRTSGGLTYLSDIYSEPQETEGFHHMVEWQNSLDFRWNLIKTDFLVTQKLTGKHQEFYLNEWGDVIEGTVDGMNMVNASATRSFLRNSLTLSLGVKNLLDVTSVAVARGGISNPDTPPVTGSRRVVHWGRSFFLGLNYTFSH